MYSFWALWKGLALLFAKVRHTSLLWQRQEHKAGGIPSPGCRDVGHVPGCTGQVLQSEALKDSSEPDDAMRDFGISFIEAPPLHIKQPCQMKYCISE